MLLLLHLSSRLSLLLLLPPSHLARRRLGRGARAQQRGLQQPAHHIQPQAVAVDGLRIAAVEALEFLKDNVRRLGRNTRPMIGHRHMDLSSVSPGRHFHRPLRGIF